jgi:glycosyltransferase involved in cell wall biosynthesis
MHTSQERPVGPSISYNAEVPSLSVVVPATDAPATLVACVRAIEAAVHPPEEVIVVDAPSGARPSTARNSGIRRAKGDVLVFVDSDVVVHSDVFDRIRAAFEADSSLSALFGSYDDDPARHGLISDFRNLLHHHVHHEGAGEATTFWSGLGAVRRSAIIEAGGFDEDLRYLEDVDLGMRLHQNNGSIRLDARIQGKHLKQWTLANMLYTDLFGRGVPWIRLLAKDRSHSTTLNLGWRHRASAAASLLFLAGLLGRRPYRIAGAVVALCALNAPFYGLLLRKRGWRQAAAGVPLHALHHLVGAAAVPTAGLLFLIERFGPLWRRLPVSPQARNL